MINQIDINFTLSMGQFLIFFKLLNFYLIHIKLFVSGLKLLCLRQELVFTYY